MAVVAAERETVPQLKGFDRFVERVMRDWKVNGVAIAVAAEGEIVYSRGFGLRDAEAGLPMTEHTLFPIASVTKTFTTASLALLADDGLVDWDTPVREYLPTFRLWDQFARERMTPRDLVTHRSGLPRHDLLWYRSSRTRQELFDRLQYLEPTSDFRTIWQYQNLMYMTAGYLAGRLTGMEWEELVRTRIFEPLGMVSAGFSVATMQQSPDFSRGYKKKDSKTVEMPFYEENEALGPAGAIVSSVADLSQWLLLHLNRGKRDGAQFLSEAQIREMHRPQMVMPRGKWPELPQSSYGMGWFVESYRGHNMIHHGGNIDGFSTFLALMPERNVGVVCLTNMNATPTRSIIPYNVFDRFIEGKAIDWNRRLKADFAEIEAAGKGAKTRSKSDRVRGTRPSHKLEAYAGSYAHPGYGTVRISLDGGKLAGSFNSMDLPLKHYHYDTFEMRYEPFDFTFKVSFFANTRGEIDRFAAPLEPTVKEIVFERTADAAMSDPAFLATLAGTYELLGNVAAVTLKGSALQISVPGMPEYELVPLRGMQFAFKDITGSTVTFQKDDLGDVTAAEISLPMGLFTATRRS